MSKTILINTLQHEGLELTVASSLRDMNSNAITPFWETLKLSGLIGKFHLTIRHKGVGSKISYPATKIVGSDNITEIIRVKFQCEPSSCYEGNLTSKSTKGQTAAIKDQLVDIAGTGLFNPKDPSTRKMLLVERKELLDVSEIVSPTITGTTGNDGTPSTFNVTKSTRSGISKNADEIGLLMQEFADKSDGGIITSDTIANILYNYTSSSGVKNNTLRGYGPIIAMWVKFGWLKAISDSLKSRLYRITEKAIFEFNIVLPPPKEISISEAAKMDYMELVNVLGAEKLKGLIETARKNAEELIATRSEINNLTEQRNLISAKIRELKAKAKNPELIASIKLNEKVPKL